MCTIPRQEWNHQNWNGQYHLLSYGHHQTCREKECIELDECALQTHGCDPTYNCFNESPWFRCCLTSWTSHQHECHCPHGWFMLSRSCYPSVCYDGYEFNDDADYCVDI